MRSQILTSLFGAAFSLRPTISHRFWAPPCTPLLLAIASSRFLLRIHCSARSRTPVLLGKPGPLPPPLTFYRRSRAGGESRRGSSARAIRSHNLSNADSLQDDDERKERRDCTGFDESRCSYLRLLRAACSASTEVRRFSQ